MPAYILRAKVGNGWTSIGAMWPLRSGDDGYSLKITSVPLQWDGRCVALLPLDNEAQDPPDEPQLPAEPARSRRKKPDDDGPIG